MPSAEWNATYYAELEKLERIREELKTALTVAQAAEVTAPERGQHLRRDPCQNRSSAQVGRALFLPRSEVNRMLAETSLF